LAARSNIRGSGGFVTGCNRRGVCGVYQWSGERRAAAMERQKKSRKSL